MPAADQVIRRELCRLTIRSSSARTYFNLLDSRGAISVTERVGVIGRVRKLALGVAQAWMDEISPKSEAVA